MAENTNTFDSQVETTYRTFINSIGEQVVRLIKQPWPRVRQEIQRQSGLLQVSYASWVIDNQSKSHLMQSSLILSAYQVLSPLLNDKAQVLEIVGNTLMSGLEEQVEAYLERRFGISQAAPEEAYEKSVNFKTLGERIFGRTFVYEREIQDETQRINVIRKCFFNDFYHVNYAHELLSKVCAVDEVWMAELNKPKYGVKAFRTTLLSKGEDGCRFHLIRSKPLE